MTLALTVICLSLSVVSIGCFCSTISPLLQGKLIFAQADSLDLRFPDSGILGRKILVLAVRPPVNLLKHLPGAIFAFSYVGPILQERRSEEKSGENVKLS